MTIEEASLLIDNAFSKVVEQDNAKLQMKRNILGAIRDGGFLKPMLIIGAPGLGKTKLITIYAALVRAILGRRPLNYKTGKSVGTRQQWVENDLVPAFNDKDAVIYIDEAHEANAGVLTFIRDMMNPTVERADHSAHSHGDYHILFQPSKHSIVLGTNKIDKLDGALVSRFGRVDLALYTDEGMEQILFNALADQNIQFSENTLRLLAQCNRGTARDIVHWVDAIRQHLAIANKRTINRDDVREIIKLRETYPLGVTAAEIRTLLILETWGDQQLKELAAKNGAIDPKEQNANEKYLLLRGLITIEGKRKLTVEGREYLKTLRRQKFIAPRDADTEEEEG